MAIYRSTEFSRAIIRDELDVPSISTTNMGEETLQNAISQISKYSKSLVESHYELVKNIKERVRKTADVATTALCEQKKMISTFQNIVNERTDYFDQLIQNCESLMVDLKAVDQLYDDVMVLSKLLEDLDNYLSAKRSVDEEK